MLLIPVTFIVTLSIICLIVPKIPDMSVQENVIYENRGINIGYQCCPCRKSNRGIHIFADKRTVYRENNVIIVTMSPVEL